MWEQNHGFPRFKKAGTMRSFVFPQMGVNPIQNSAVKQARIVRRSSGWYVMLTLQWDVMPHGEGIGFDVGITHFAATSNGRLFPNPRPFRKLERKLNSKEEFARYGDQIYESQVHPQVEKSNYLLSADPN
jgi:putative transposase